MNTKRSKKPYSKGKYLMTRLINSNRIIALILAMAFSLVVIFDGLQIYRSIVFKTVPHDDYGPYLQLISTFGEEGQVPKSPWKERAGSVVMTLPFLIFPSIDFSGEMLIGSELRPYYLALSISNSFYFYLAWLIIFQFTFNSPGKEKYHTRNNVLLFWSALFVSRQVLGLAAMDGVGVFLVAAALFLVQRRMYFALSVYAFAMLGFNEKVTVVIFAFFSVDALINKGKWSYFGATLLALLIYFGYRSYFGGGGSTQTSMNLVEKISSFYTASVSSRGILLNVIPLIFCTLCIFYADSRYGKVVGGAILAILLFASIQADVVYNVGRIVFYGVPFYFYFSLAQTSASDRLIYRVQ